MYNWLLLATRWRRDGTPYPNRKLVNALADGDPMAIAFVAAFVLCIAGRAYYRSFHKR
jgi:hypothetical protein